MRLAGDPRAPLNDPSGYEGGVLELNQGTSVVRVAQAPGAPIIFPSWRQVLRLATAAGGGAYRNFGKTCSPSKRIVRSTSSTGMSPMLTRRLNWVTPASTYL